MFTTDEHKKNAGEDFSRTRIFPQSNVPANVEPGVQYLEFVGRAFIIIGCCLIDCRVLVVVHIPAIGAAIIEAIVFASVVLAPVLTAVTTAMAPVLATMTTLSTHQVAHERTKHILLLI